MSWTLWTTKAKQQHLFFCRRTLEEYCSWKCRNAPPGSATQGHLAKWVWISQVLPHMGSLGPASLFSREDITGALWIKTSATYWLFCLQWQHTSLLFDTIPSISQLLLVTLPHRKPGHWYGQYQGFLSWTPLALTLPKVWITEMSGDSHGFPWDGSQLCLLQCCQNLLG